MKTRLLFTILTISFTWILNAQSIGIIGDFSGWANDVDLTTLDNISYTKDGYYLSSGGLQFRQDDAWTNQWGTGSGAGFPSDTSNSGNNILVSPAGFYDITFNINTGEYNFVTATPTNQNISIIGDFNSWTDTALSTTDNITYTATDVALTTGGLKFRRDGSWDISYGGTTLSGTGNASGGSSNIPISLNGNYDISFNLETFEYSITDSTLGVTEDFLNEINIFYNRNTLNIIGFNGELKVKAYNVHGQLINDFETERIINNYQKTIILPYNQLSFIMIEGTNFNKILKVFNQK